jgi:hypothetical protein
LQLPKVFRLEPDGISVCRPDESFDAAITAAALNALNVKWVTEFSTKQADRKLLESSVLRAATRSDSSKIDIR